MGIREEYELPGEGWPPPSHGGWQHIWSLSTKLVLEWGEIVTDKAKIQRNWCILSRTSACIYSYMVFLRNQLFSAHRASVAEHRVQALGKLMKQPYRLALSHNPLRPTWNPVFPQESFVALLEIPLFTSSPSVGQVGFSSQGYSVLASAIDFSPPKTSA